MHAIALAIIIYENEKRKDFFRHSLKWVYAKNEKKIQKDAGMVEWTVRIWWGIDCCLFYMFNFSQIFNKILKKSIFNLN